MTIPLIENHYLKNRGKLVKRMYFRTGSNAAAEDIVQTAYERAIRYSHTMKGDSFDKWFSIIIRNSLHEYYDAERGYSHWEDDDEETTDDTSCPHYPARVMAEILEMIEKRSIDQREILTFYFEQEYTAKDISQITEYSYAQVHKTISRFRAELKNLYKDSS